MHDLLMALSAPYPLNTWQTLLLCGGTSVMGYIIGLHFGHRRKSRDD